MTDLNKETDAEMSEYAKEHIDEIDRMRWKDAHIPSLTHGALLGVVHYIRMEEKSLRATIEDLVTALDGVRKVSRVD